MEEAYIIRQVFEKEDYTQQPLARGEYDGCRFESCDFSGCDLSGIVFVDCVFLACNMSMAELNRTTCRNIAFEDCKMLGMRFDNCNAFGISLGFRGCILNHASFYRMKLKGTAFRNCQLREVDFSGAELGAAVFDDCDLSGANFENAVLEKADLRTAHNYSIDPEQTRIRGARFSYPAVLRLLERYGIDVSH